MKASLTGFLPWKIELPKTREFYLYAQFWNYKPRQALFVETSRYVLKTAQTMSELKEVFKLRHQIFLGHQDASEKYDTDEFDLNYDHIIIIDKEKNKVCGTYRISCSRYVDQFYSQTEFHLGEFLAQDGVKVELGRACIHHAHRNGQVIDLLWKGISLYCKNVNAQYLFGCSSVHTNDLTDIKNVNIYIKNNEKYSDQYRIRSYGQFEIMEAEVADESNDFYDEARGKKILPSLLRSYFNAGAKVFGVPAYDEDFSCFDYLTILRMSDVSDSFKRRYFTYL